MKNGLLPLLCFIAAPALGGPMEDACLARGTWDAATCTCMQEIAAKHMTTEDQMRIVTVVTGQTDVRGIAAELGMEAAQALMEKFAAFGAESKAACGAP